MELKRSLLISGLVICLLSVFSCQRYRKVEEDNNKSDKYFSIKQYAADQIQMNFGQPYSLYRIARDGDKLDSTIVNYINIDWPPIFRIIEESDISAPKFLGSYDFSMYEDPSTGTRGLMYTAKKPELLTRLLQISIDPTNNRIVSIYMETEEPGFWTTRYRKVLFVPMHLIHIQDSEHRLIGKARNLMIDYRFMRDDEE